MIDLATHFINILAKNDVNGVSNRKQDFLEQ